MIIPMKKYSFLIYHKEYEEFLKSLQEIGVLHIEEKKEEISDDLRESFNTINQLKEVSKFLSKREVESNPADDERSGTEIMKEVNELREKQASLQQHRKTLDKQIKQVEPWGDFSLETVEKLKQQGIYIRFFVVSEKHYDPQWEETYNIAIVNQVEKDIYFVVFSYGEETVDINAEEVSLPDKPVSEYYKERDEVDKQLNEIERKLDEYAAKYSNHIQHAINTVREQTDYMAVKENTLKQAEDKVMLLSGWVPQSKENTLLEFLDTWDVLYVPEDTTQEKARNIPVLLRNNKFARLFEPVGNLFSLPNAREIDMTPFFAPFFAVFFGFCLGDAGYGILYIVATEIIKRKKPQMKSIMTMAQILGVTTVIFGILTGTVFGIMIPQNEALLQISEPLREYKEAFIDNQELFNLALYIGIFQIIFGMFLKVFNRTMQYGFVYSVSTIGWLLLLLSSIVTFGFLSGGSQAAFMPVYKVLAVISGILVLFFSNPEGNIFARFGAGIWDTYNTLTGLLGDVLSYVRLFAIGISTAILGFVFNQMALSLSPSFPVFGQLVFVIIILIGHGLNLFMSSLGSFVHPLRLTFVEFYNNSGFEGGGEPYKPFSKQTQ